MRKTAWIAILVLFTGACADEADGPGDVSDGEAVYRGVVEDGNTFTCATCHALSEPAADGVRRPGHAIGGATRRANYKNGQLPEFLDAVNSCLQDWMNAEPWTPDDTRFAALSRFIEAQPGDGEALEFQVVDPPANLAGGDASAGQDLFNTSCAVCHGEDGEGTNQAIAVDHGMLAPEYIARRVRTSGRPDSDVYDGLTGGVMPFWSADRLSNEELLDLVAWLSRNFDDNASGGTDTGAVDGSGGSDDSGGSTGDTGGDPTGDPINCVASHPRVGQTAVLNGLFHGVGGTAEIVDDCTIVLHDFTFDGQGIDVRLYGGVGGNYDAGFAIGDDLRSPNPYEGETLEFVLPTGTTFDDLDGVSIWCVPAGVDFGSGLFE